MCDTQKSHFGIRWHEVSDCCSRTDSVNIPVIERAKAGFSFGHNIVKNNCIQCGLVESWLIPDLLYKAFCDESDLCIPVSE